MPELHSLLGASSSARWLACPPSVRLCKAIPDSGSAYAEEGTLAHKVAASALLQVLSENGIPVQINEDAECSAADVSREMRDYVDEYVQFVLAVCQSMDVCEGVFLEQPVSYEDYAPSGFGTSDVIIVGGDEITVIDFKYGMVPVDARQNPQLRLYALGALLGVGVEISVVHTWIAQPRINSYSEEQMTADELLRWADEVVRPAALLAYQGDGEFHSGPHCRFCKARDMCRTRVNEALNVAAVMPSVPDELPDHVLGALLPAVEQIARFAAEFKEYALARAVDGADVRGYALKISKPRRKIRDEEELIEHLQTCSDLKPEEYMKAPALRSQTDLRKTLGGKLFRELVEPHLVAASGGGTPSLVRTSEANGTDPYSDALAAMQSLLE